MKVIKIAIAFARPFINDFHAEDYIEDIKKALLFARCNLLLRYRIELSPDLKETPNGTWYVEMTVPEDANITNIGYRLRGISVYLLKNWPDKYEPLKIANRLLYYEVI